MNGYEYKREIERIIKVARKMYPKITDDMLDNNGVIYYFNGNDGTKFDRNVNDCLCEFYVFYKSGCGFIKAFVNRDNSINVYIYMDGEMKPTYKFTERMETCKAKEFAKIMDYIADMKCLWDQPINDLDWDVDSGECYDIEGEY